MILEYTVHATLFLAITYTLVYPLIKTRLKRFIVTKIGNQSTYQSIEED